MGFVYCFGVYLFCLSVWAVIQMALMAFAYSIESTTLLEDVSPVYYNGTIDFLIRAKQNYQLVSGNCYFAAYTYVVLLVLSWFVIFQGKIMDKKAGEKILGTDTILLRS
nr:uncharacterized protein LOC128677556 [Plodia interpunctella]